MCRFVLFSLKEGFFRQQQSVPPSMVAGPGKYVLAQDCAYRYFLALSSWLRVFLELSTSEVVGSSWIKAMKAYVPVCFKAGTLNKADPK